MQEIYLKIFYDEKYHMEYCENKEQYERLMELIMNKCDTTREEILSHYKECILEFDNSNCRTIKEAIKELYKGDKNEALSPYKKYIITEKDINNGFKKFSIKTKRYWNVGLFFDIIEINKDNLIESKIENARIEVI